ncbi:cell division protein FtsQ/DivIB, partial [Nitrosomonas sp.]|uniref:cell division protein FtsQ/DivIB n=1 Tax=Nitrosomonas sp. TaxID=42353 RepID=UPI0025D75D71
MDNAQLPIFTGPDKSSHLITNQYHVFNKLLQPTGYSVAEIALTPRHAWHIRLNTGTWLRLGRKQIIQRLQRYVAVHRQYHENLDWEGHSAYVDLRYVNGFAVRTH